MSRTQITLKCNDNERASQVANQILDSNRYDYIQKNGEDYWKQGVGVTQSPKFIRYYFDEGNMILEGWVNNFGNESDLDGFVGALPKKSCKNVLNEIKENVENLNSQTFADTNSLQLNDNIEKGNSENLGNQSPSNQDSDQLKGRTMIKSGLTADASPGNYVNMPSVNANIQQNNSMGNFNNLSSNNNANQNGSTSNGIIPRRYRGSILTNIFEILLALFYIFGASTGRLVLRFTDSSEALILVAIIILIHGVLSLISNLSDK